MRTNFTNVRTVWRGKGIMSIQNERGHTGFSLRQVGIVIATLIACCGEPVLGATSEQEVLVRLQPGSDVQAFARRQGLTYQRTLISDPNMHVLTAATRAEATSLVKATSKSARARMSSQVDPVLESAWLNGLSRNKPMAFVPNDPYFKNNNPVGFPGQWHLVYTNHTEWDAGVQGAWNRDLTGTNILIGICDDGFDRAHPDLSPGYSAQDSYNFIEKRPDPSPVLPGDNHGTSVGGVAGARGGNGIGVTGAAPFASLAGLRVLNTNATSADYVDATLFHSSGTNRNIRIKNHSYGVDVPFVDQTAERDAFQKSAEAGTIHCLAAGNERGARTDDSNKQAPPASPYVINVAALSSQGIFASYSSFGANVFVTAPSSSFRDGEYLITTTDRLGTNGYNNVDDPVNPYPDRDYTADFGGTSSACPLVAGIMALGLQANPNMNVRLAKHLLARSSDRVDLGDATETSDGGWKTNAAGFVFNQNYGFGKINADRFTRLAVNYAGVTPLGIYGYAEPVPVNLPLHAKSSTQFSLSLDVTNPMETVEMRLVITNIVCRDLEVFLTAPTGTRSRMLMRGLNDTNGALESLDWTCVSHAFWGENPKGNWTVTVTNTGSIEGGPWLSCRIAAYTGLPVPRPEILAGSMKYYSDGQFQFTFSGLTGTTNIVQVSTNLARWDFLTQVILTSSTADVRDTNATPAWKFYRIVMP